MWTLLRRITLTQWIVIAMLVGIAVGIAFPHFGVALLPLSTAFIRLIKSIIVPLIFGTLVVGIAGHGDDMKRVGRLALKSIVYFEIVTTLALFIGLFAVNTLKPGVGATLTAADLERLDQHRIKKFRQRPQDDAGMTVARCDLKLRTSDALQIIRKLGGKPQPPSSAWPAVGGRLFGQ